ncbi:MAG: sulfite exporter TauE/SafE family protein [Cyanobacteria bacterium]|nr:sulfite exporter TauE/SafE family protein [Cyanobacteriota bacterium]
MIFSLIFIASLLGTITGFGTSTIMMPVLMFYYPTAEVLFFVSIIHWFNALWRLILFRKGFDLKLVMSFGLVGMIAAYFGAKTFFVVDEVLIKKSIAVFLFAYAIFLGLNPKFKISFNYFTGALGGALSGFVAGIFGMGGAIRGAFLSAFDLPKAVYLANSALLLMLIDSSRLLTYFNQGLRFDHLLGLSYMDLALCISVSFVGVQAGKMIVDKIPQEKFRIGIAMFLLLIAVKLFV